MVDVRDRLQSFAVRWLEEHRGLVIVLFCLPASFLFDLAVRLLKTVERILWFHASHSDRVRSIQKEVRNWNALPKSERKLMCISKPNWMSLSTTFFPKDRCHRINVNFGNILELDENNLTLRTEPNVSIGEITDYLLRRGYMLAVCLEIKDATAGGLAFAVGMTTHSHKAGLYQETVVCFEVVLADGSLITVTKDNEHSDLFYCLPWSHGTLGFLVAVTLKIIKVKQYVRVNYIPVHSQEEYCKMLMDLSGANETGVETPDFLEATIYSKTDAVIMKGDFADVDSVQKWRKVNRASRWYKPWFYKHTEQFLHAAGEEYIPLKDYLFRHNRAIFWVLESMIPFGNHPFVRLLFGWLCPPKPAFLKFTTTQLVRQMTFKKQVFQDIVMPLATLKDQVDKATKLFDTFPLLVYPCRIYNHERGPQGQLRPPPSELLVPGTNYAIYNDLGIYGTPGPVRRKEKYNATYAMREMEKFTRDVGGYSFLYADVFMTENEFNEMFDMTLYNQMRKRYGGEGAFPNLFEKIKPEVDVIALGQED
ncbi:hypothetical protein QR680_001372 [Steinernema hermaphroditum]|uniref:Delta(24)-sterol reductase n=1 Tax=Steinernema hermaphroditum TaxID=289476 RepID=A0AA39GY39_9BILA|nr:hypothetical protein QR680_001372 [Steinernema hermaphroditum]